MTQEMISNVLEVENRWWTVKEMAVHMLDIKGVPKKKRTKKIIEAERKMVTKYFSRLRTSKQVWYKIPKANSRQRRSYFVFKHIRWREEEDRDTEMLVERMMGYNV